MIVTSYKLAANVELVNMEPFLTGEIQGQVPMSLRSEHSCQTINTFLGFMCVSLSGHLIQ